MALPEPAFRLAALLGVLRNYGAVAGALNRSLKVNRRTQTALNGDTYRARQDTFNDDIWYFEHYPKGESKASMKICISDHNCTELFKLLKQEKPKQSYGNWTGRKWLAEEKRTAILPIYKKIMQGGHND